MCNSIEVSYASTPNVNIISYGGSNGLFFARRAGLGKCQNMYSNEQDQDVRTTSEPRRHHIERHESNKNMNIAYIKIEKKKKKQMEV